LRGPLGVNLLEAALDRNNHQGWYGESFVRVLAAAAGFGVAKPEPDVAGIDLHIVGMTEVGDDYPLAKVQVKSWSRAPDEEQAWRYSGLTEKQFNVLAGSRAVPVYLFLVVVPPQATDYARADQDHLRLARAAYWVSFANEPRIPNPSAQRRVTVQVPRTQLLTVESLAELCSTVFTSPAPRSEPTSLTEAS
jgi:hypothetical protein